MKKFETTYEILYKSLNFLIKKYGMKYNLYTDQKENYHSFYNDSGCFTFYEWSQFQDRFFYVSDKFGTINDICQKSINIFEKREDLLKQWRKNHSGIKWWFKDKRKDYWKLIAFIIKKEIDEKGEFFGIKV